MAKYELLKQEGRAKRGTFHTVHGDIQTPVFMNVGTVGAIKGAVSTDDLKEIKCQVELSNTYHLHVRTGDKIIKELGGLHKFMVWDRPILTDSGGFQVFSLAGLRKIKEEGVYFNSHIDGAKIFMGPEESMQIQSNLGSTIAMAFDECPSSVADRQYVTNSVNRTTRWLERCKKEMARLNSLPDTINKEQLLFGINQGAIYDDIRIDHAKRISELELDGYAVGGLAVGESHEEMYHILDETVPHLPVNKPTYLMASMISSSSCGTKFLISSTSEILWLNRTYPLSIFPFPVYIILFFNTFMSFFLSIYQCDISLVSLRRLIEQ